jgi:hypothetical protein
VHGFIAPPDLAEGRCLPDELHVGFLLGPGLIRMPRHADGDDRRAVFLGGENLRHPRGVHPRFHVEACGYALHPRPKVPLLKHRSRSLEDVLVPFSARHRIPLDALEKFPDRRCAEHEVVDVETEKDEVSRESYADREAVALGRLTSGVTLIMHGIFERLPGSVKPAAPPPLVHPQPVVAASGVVQDDGVSCELHGDDAERPSLGDN